MGRRIIRNEVDAIRDLVVGQKSNRIKRETPLFQKPSRSLGEVVKVMIAITLWAIALNLWGVL